jgi:cell fate (sporulation/competence/biofilm development) regulator YlbF (YheA/YmcA/DUF963 family)
LKNFSTNDLETMLRVAKEGALVCNDCKKMCQSSKYASECSVQQRVDFQPGKKTSHRMYEDQRMIEKINRELQRRRNVANFRVQNNYLPSVPKTAPSW